MSYWQRQAVGTYSAGEGYLLIRNAGQLEGDRRRAVIWLHGGNGNYFGASPSRSPNTARLIRRVVAAGYVVLHPDAGGPQTWGNDPSTGLISAGIEFLQRNKIALDGPVALVGGSMANITACNWALRNKDRVAAIAGFMPACDLMYHYANGYQAGIDAAYDGQFLAQRARHNPVEFATQLGSIPWRGYYTTDDPLVPLANQQVFAAALGSTASLTSLGAGGHSDLPVAAVDATEMIAFLDAGRW